MPSESTIETAVSKYAKDRGCYVRKFKSPSNRGVPDRLFITPNGVVFFIEFKAPGKEPTKMQTDEALQIRKRKVRAGFADSTHKGKEMVDNMLKIEIFEV